MCFNSSREIKKEFNMLVSPISQTNNNTSFQSLNKIKYAGLFNPQKVSEHAEAVKAFKNSDAFKKFFDKFNGSATFSDLSSLNDWHKLNLSLTYKKAGEKESGIKKIFGAIKNIFSPNKNEINITEYSDKMYSTPDERFVDTIKNTKYEDLIKQVK